jgi:hypothetical protein
MRVRTLTISALTAGVLCGGAATGQALGAAPGAGRVSATVEVCHPAADLASRYATFGAQMSAVAGTQQMSIRFELDQRTPAGPDFHPLTGAPGFDVWKSSAPGVDIFGFSQEVSSLPSPGTYRVTVSYRWIGAHHRVIKRAHRSTPACNLPVSSANLVVGTLSRQSSGLAPASGIVGALCGGATTSPAPAGPTRESGSGQDSPTVVCP